MIKYNVVFFVVFLLLQFNVMAIDGWQMKPSIGGVGRHRGLGISIGNKGYIGTGHYNGTGVNISFNDWWEYDPSSNSWTQKANVPTPTYGSVAWGSSTKGYVGGGSIPGGIYYIYNPSTNSWTNSAPCPINASNFDCFVVGGIGYVLSSSEMYAYKPITDSWTQKTPCPINLLTWSCAFEIETSGFVKSGPNFYEYKPSIDIWIQRANFPGVMTSAGTAFSVYGKGYVACGYVGSLANVTSEFWEFNPATNNWTQMADFPGTSRRFLSSFSIGNKGYISIGTNGTNFNDFWQFHYNPLSVDELYFSEDNIKAFPNPVKDYTHIIIEPKVIEYIRGASIQIKSIDGRILDEKEINDTSIFFQRRNEASGVYYYSIVKNGNTIYNGKLLYL